MSLLDLLRSFFKPAEPGDPVQKAHRLARLLVSEIRMYNEEAVEKLRRESVAPRDIVEDLSRSYQMYIERVDLGDDAHSIFEKEAANVMTGGDLQALHRALPELATWRSSQAQGGG